MPRYIDYHAKMPSLPPEAVKETVAAIKSGKADKFGVKPLNAFIAKSGSGWCVTEAPNADAVCKSHEAKGMKLEKSEVYEITTLA